MADTRSQPKPRKPPPSRRSFIAGPTGSGKTHLLRVWAIEYPRQLILDATAEWASPSGFQGTIVWAADRPQLVKALHDVAGLGRWRVVIPTDRIEPDELTRLLVPILPPGRSSFPRAVGGLCLVIDEAAELASHENSRKVKPLWLRGRHHGLSILAASQRAADVGRMVTSQSQRIAVLQTDEPLDLAYWRSALRREWYDAVTLLQFRQAVVIDREKKSAAICATDGRVIRPIVTGGLAAQAAGDVG